MPEALPERLRQWNPEASPDDRVALGKVRTLQKWKRRRS